MPDRRSDYLYDLPERLIAQEPIRDRSSSRLLVLDRLAGKTSHRRFHEISSFLKDGDILVLNDTRVIPARLFGKRKTGGTVELLLLREIEKSVWECLAKPARRLPAGEIIDFPGGRSGTVLEVGAEGRRIVRFEPDENFFKWLEAEGATPLPPYIHRAPSPGDRERYQTVYARHPGAVAAPTAGLHFTEELLDELRQRGIDVAQITLHVGIGTFRPVTVENLSDHVMDSEEYLVPESVAKRIRQTRERGGRVIAVGTTVVRTLETVADEAGFIRPGSGEAGLFIRPPYRFKAVDAMITNFHLPGSTLLMLVSAFAGRERILNAYREAIRREYRFFSYGDAMLII